MARQGKYTPHRSRLWSVRTGIHRRWVQFRGLSRKRQIMVISIPVVAFLILTPLVTYAVLARDISDPERLMNRNNTGVELLDTSGAVFYSSGNSKPLKRLPLDQISDHAEKALVASEDKNFYEHSGVSFTGLLAALYANLANKDLTAYGGSTLTQQLVKNTLLSSSKSFLRKYQELFIAIAVDRSYSKDEILDMYLNSVYYGEGAFGIDEAAKTYFGKSASDLTLAESSMLIGILPAPAAYSPINGSPEKAKVQQERVLRRMQEDGKITTDEKAAALATSLSYAPQSESKIGNAPHFAEMVVAELNERYGEETVTRSGYRVTTTLNLEWQKQAEQIVADQTAINARLGGRNAAMVAIDPKNGEIRTLVGSADYSDPTFGKVNMAIAARQPGSSFKPIYYTEALAKKQITPATIMKDEAKTYGSYKPNNYDFRFRGDISIRNALSQSLNIPAVDVMQELGVDQAIKTANRMGIESVKADGNYGLALALGAAEAKPLEMTNAYAAFANGGQQFEPAMIRSIESKYGKTIYKSKPKSTRVQSEQASFLISDILSDNTARAPTFGGSLNIAGRDVAVKTGSTDDNRDAWTIGYTPSLAVGVWVGNNENEVMQSGGSAFAGPIWRKSIQAFLGDSKDEGFKQPGGVQQVTVCKSNGLRSLGGNSETTYKEFFMSGSVPSGTCNSTTKYEPKAETKDSDNDGVNDDKDKCPNTPSNSDVDGTGCPKVVDKDSDNDGVSDDKDDCPNTPAGVEVDGDGCPVVEDPNVDTDNDGVPDALDTCPNTPTGTQVDANGCPVTTGGGSPQGTLVPERRRA